MYFQTQNHVTIAKIIEQLKQFEETRKFRWKVQLFQNMGMKWQRFSSYSCCNVGAGALAKLGFSNEARRLFFLPNSRHSSESHRPWRRCWSNVDRQREICKTNAYYLLRNAAFSFFYFESASLRNGIGFCFEILCNFSRSNETREPCLLRGFPNRQSWPTLFSDFTCNSRLAHSRRL